MEEPSMSNIETKRTNGLVRSYEISSTATIGELKQQMVQKEYISVDRYVLIYQGKQLEDDYPISNIKNCIHVVWRSGKTDSEKGLDPGSNLGRGFDHNNTSDFEDEMRAPGFWAKTFSNKSLVAIGSISLIALAVWYFGSDSKDSKSTKKASK